MSKILILSGSPQRDKLIDQLLKEHLEKLGNEVFIRPVPLGTHKAILEIKPDVLVMPPIKNVFAYDIGENCARWGVAVVIRHIEAGPDEDDIKNMLPAWRQKLFYRRPKGIKLELIWGEIEANYTKKYAQLPHLIVPVGAFVADIYKGDCLKKLTSGDFVSEYNFDADKRTLLVGSPWGLMDIDSDHLGQSSNILLQDREAKDNWIKMIKVLHSLLSDKWNILLRPHPGVVAESYKKIAIELKIPIDTQTPAAELLANCDALVHSGSTMAIEMHWLDKPSFQYGDVNSIELPDKNWWQRADCPISQISPFYIDVKKLAAAIKDCKETSNANVKAIDKLEKGRYGNMDGKATERAAFMINKLTGKFQMRWPLSRYAKPSAFAFREVEQLFASIQCSACDEMFWMIRGAFFDLFKQQYNIKELTMPATFFCPVCGAPLINRPTDIHSIRGNYWGLTAK